MPRKRELLASSDRITQPVDPVPAPDLDEIRIPPRFCGPPHWGNGGYVCGRLAEGLPGPVEVTLRRPVPVDRVLLRRTMDDHAALWDADAVLAEARTVSEVGIDPQDVPRVAKTDIGGGNPFDLNEHPFPGCFVCGHTRTPGDGLRLLPQRTGAEGRVAAIWQLDLGLDDGHGCVRPEFLWAALDCPGAWALASGGRLPPAVLGRLVVDVRGPVSLESKPIVVGWRMDGLGRKRFAGTAILVDDEPVAIGRATWILLDPEQARTFSART